MFKKNFKLIMIAMLCAGIFVSTCGSALAAYPNKPVKVIVAFSPGGGTDTAARVVFKYAEKYLGQKFAVVNKPGASGEIGFTSIAMARPDGYTIGFINPPTILLHPIQRGKKCRYTLADFAPIANIVMDPGVIVVKADSPFKTLKDFVETAKAKKDSVSIGYGGPGTSEARVLSKFQKDYDFSLKKVPFDGSAPSVVALLGGHVDACIMNVSEIANQLNEGTVRLLGVGSATRSDMAPETPTFKEQGYDVLQVSYRGVAAPAKMKPEQLKVIEEAIAKTLKDPEFLKRAAEMQLPLQYMDAKEYTETLNEMNKYYQEEWKTSPW